MAADQEPEKALTKNPLGPSGEAVAANVERLLKEQNLTFAALSDRLAKIGRTIPPLGLRKIVRRTRRVDADDLIGLAVALGVSPVTLLMPETHDAGEMVGTTGADEELTAQQLWDWLRGSYPLPGDDRLTLVFRAAAWPGWRLTDQVQQDRKTQAAWLKARRAERREQELLSDGDD
ncbi:hypothetical protein [Mycobacterium sp. 852002-51961_SCH5331710]|uniref:hypothetical protein n=1 Tax=Mycobacterium sp. 852002-51961_SCH5331710 TaxID=1834105 RepID=UPI0007FF4CFA|nr:hypothetical protein [Mycobacterium sp. 852002-51961_SCH5331710]OBB42707.1 hypothetical protein A5752_06235 [Mycobacterium sp. 852002-51961_SCH5331710]